MHEEFPAVYHLPIHLPRQQPVYFGEDLSRDELQLRLDTTQSKLMSWFTYNQEHQDGRQYLYQQFPQYFVFKDQDKRWHPRKRGFAIGRMYHCNPLQGERFYPRLLLTVVLGATSFDNLRTINSQTYATFQQACLALGIIQDDTEWIQCFEEAIVFSTGHTLRTFFATAVMYSGIIDPTQIWTCFQQYFC